MIADEMITIDVRVVFPDPVSPRIMVTLAELTARTIDSLPTTLYDYHQLGEVNRDIPLAMGN
jgi:hypothetical protein